MADYIYLLENRLSLAQRNALNAVRELARSKNLTVFLVGGAVRDLTTGSPVRDLDVVVQGNALKLRKDLESLAAMAGEIEPAQALFFTFPGGVRMEIGSTLSVTYPKPGKPVFKPATILDDLRRRDFTANAMALSLNEGSYGLLMDPLNGVADIENRELRLVSNYGFIEDPIRMVRAARLMARLGWTMDEKTQQRYDTGKEEGYISALSDLLRGYETEEIVHEEDPLRVLKRLEAEGWMQHLAPFWISAKVDVAALEALREAQTQLQMQGIHPDPSAANFPALTAKLSPDEIAKLKAGFTRQGFVSEIEALEARAKELGSTLSSKAAALPSQTWKILTSALPEAVLWLAYSSKSSALQAKLKSFYTVWPQARQKIPYALLQEMRIVPELPGYDDLLEKLFFELMDDKLQTPEEMKAFLEPFSPPAPPPPVSMRRARAPKKETKAAKARAKKAAEAEDEDSEEDVESVVTEAVDSDDVDDGSARTDADAEDDDEEIAGEDEEAEEEPEAAQSPAPAVTSKHATPAKAPAKQLDAQKSGEKPASQKVAAAKAVPVKQSHARKQVVVVAPPPARKAAAPAKAPVKQAPAPIKQAAKKVAPAKSVPAKSVPAKSVSAKSAPAKSAPAKSAPAKSVSAKSLPSKSAPAKTAAPKKAVPAKRSR